MSEVIYVGHDARLSFQVYNADGDALDLSDAGERVGRVTFHLAGITLDSDTSPSAFDWQTRGTEGVVDIALTGYSFPAGAHGARLVLYSPSYPAGLVVADGYPVRVEEAIEGIDPTSADLSTLRTILQTPGTGLGSDLVAWVGQPGKNMTDALASPTGVHGVGSGAVVGTTLAQTLTNKSLSAPVIASPSVSGGMFEAPTVSNPAIANPVIGAAQWGSANHAHLDAATGGLLANVAVMRGYLSGFALSNGPAAAEIVLAPGTCAGENQAGMLTRTAALTKSIDAAWAEGSGGGLPTSVLKNNATWYHFFVIGKWDTAAKTWIVDAGFDTTTTASNLLAASAFTEYRRVGSVYYVDGTTKLKKFFQGGDCFLWDVPPCDATGAPCSTSAVLHAVSVPMIGGIRAVLTVAMNETSGTGRQHYGLITSPLQADTAPTSSSWNTTIFENGSAATCISQRFEILTNIAQVRARWQYATGNYSIATLGWIDTRGK